MCIADGTEKCKDPENNRPNGVCIMWGCPQAARQSRGRCTNCGMPIPEPPEDACGEEMLCDACYSKIEYSTPPVRTCPKCHTKFNGLICPNGCVTKTSKMKPKNKESVRTFNKKVAEIER